MENDDKPRDITLEVGEVMDKFIEELAELKVRSHKLEVLAAAQVKGLTLLSQGLAVHQRIIEAIVPLLDKILGQEPDERLAAELRGAVTDIDELRRLYGEPNPPPEK